MSTGSQARLIVADDEADIRRLVSFTLRRRGHTILEASRGDEAFKLIVEERPDLAILDVMMPGMTGVQIARSLSQHADLAGMPVVLLSVKGQAHEIADGLESGAATYMVKPFSPGALAARVDELLMQPPSRKEASSDAP